MVQSKLINQTIYYTSRLHHQLLAVRLSSQESCYYPISFFINKNSSCRGKDSVVKLNKGLLNNSSNFMHVPDHLLRYRKCISLHKQGSETRSEEVDAIILNVSYFVLGLFWLYVSSLYVVMGVWSRQGRWHFTLALMIACKLFQSLQPQSVMAKWDFASMYCCISLIKECLL